MVLGTLIYFTRASLPLALHTEPHHRETRSLEKKNIEEQNLKAPKSTRKAPKTVRVTNQAPSPIVLPSQRHWSQYCKESPQLSGNSKKKKKDRNQLPLPVQIPTKSPNTKSQQNKPHWSVGWKRSTDPLRPGRCPSQSSGPTPVRRTRRCGKDWQQKHGSGYSNSSVVCYAIRSCCFKQTLHSGKFEIISGCGIRKVAFLEVISASSVEGYPLPPPQI